MKIHQLVGEVFRFLLEAPEVELREGLQRPSRHFRGRPLLRECTEVPEGDLRPRVLELTTDTHEVPEDLDLMHSLVFILILIPPQTQLNQ